MTHATAAVTRREVALVLVLGAVLAAYFTWPMAPKLGSVGRLEMGDGQFSVWNVAWVAHAIVTPGVAMFDANIFHPHHGTLAYSEPNLGAGLVAVPAYLLSGGNPYAAHNSVVLVSLALAVLGMYLLARWLTGSREGALVATIARGGVAEDAGIQAGDIITRIGDVDVNGETPLLNALMGFEPGEAARVVLNRNGRIIEAEVRLAKRS